MTVTTTDATTTSADGTTLAYDTTAADGTTLAHDTTAADGTTLAHDTTAASDATTDGASTKGRTSTNGRASTNDGRSPAGRTHTTRPTDPAGRTDLAQALVVVDGALTRRLQGVLPLAALLPVVVVRYDRRGRGGSSDTPPYAVEREIEDLAAVIDTVGGRAALLGVASGAFLALRAAADLGPHRVVAVAAYEAPYDVASGGPAADPRQIHGVEERVGAGDPGGAVEVFLDVLGMPARYLTRMRSSPSWASLEAVAPTLAYDGRVMRSVTGGEGALVARWQEVTQPVLVADGGASAAFVRAAGDSLARALPHAHRVTLLECGPESGHDVDAAALAPALGALLRHGLVDCPG
ncbi:alpha/beta hydrolase [Antribacter sp. KLBMP9083]|uniref:Alpha/beta hydrolase n=1 Tax=Antribacter soli TaxID=2910976 RepID=A0AA41QBM4_9MICO|nr:alpha/beta fold hydrolase [Antribacter soli]MCF4120475.1 alpha/beta hydrolase [Antribacter soli]